MNALNQLPQTLLLASLMTLALSGCEPNGRNAAEPSSPKPKPSASADAATDQGLDGGTSPRAVGPPPPTRDGGAAPGPLAVPRDPWIPAAQTMGPAPQPPIELSAASKKAQVSRGGMVVSGEPPATKIGVQILEAGGNAIDAAVAVGYALAVTHPQAGPLGGGGFMIIRRADGQVFALDYREISPAKANDKTNQQMLKKGAHGYASAPVPGVVAGLNLAREKFGTMPLSELIAPALKLARDGHRFGQGPARVLHWFWDRVSKDPTFKAIYGRGDKALKAGQRFKQPSLAKTLQLISDRGNKGFYQGEVATKIEKAMRNGGGYVRAADLARYRAVLRQPLKFRYRGVEIYTMPPPSMGGIALASIMHQLERLHAHQAAANTALSIHFFAEAARRAYADRRAVGADPAFQDQRLLSARLGRLFDPQYYDERKPAIDPNKATPSRQITPLVKALPNAPESPDTTHFSVVDRQGNAVSCTTTISAGFGAWVIPPGTGVILSNALGAFTPTGINRIEPGKRMASSMTPAIAVEHDGQRIALLGSPGGDTIPNTVAQVLRNLVDYGLAIDQAVDHGRVHHQWWPDKLRVEKLRPPPPKAMRGLMKRGHRVERFIPLGHANTIVLDLKTHTAYGYADPRKGGLAMGAKRAP